MSLLFRDTLEYIHPRLWWVHLFSKEIEMCQSAYPKKYEKPEKITSFPNVDTVAGRYRNRNRPVRQVTY